MCGGSWARSGRVKRHQKPTPLPTRKLTPLIDGAALTGLSTLCPRRRSPANQVAVVKGWVTPLDGPGRWPFPASRRRPRSRRHGRVRHAGATLPAQPAAFSGDRRDVAVAPVLCRRRAASGGMARGGNIAPFKPTRRWPACGGGRAVRTEHRPNQSGAELRFPPLRPPRLGCFSGTGAVDEAWKTHNRRCACSRGRRPYRGGRKGTSPYSLAAESPPKRTNTVDIYSIPA